MVLLSVLAALNTAIHLVLRQQSAAELISLRTEKQTQVENLGKQCDLLFLEMKKKKRKSLKWCNDSVEQ